MGGWGGNWWGGCGAALGSDSSKTCHRTRRRVEQWWRRPEADAAAGGRRRCDERAHPMAKMEIFGGSKNLTGCSSRLHRVPAFCGRRTLWIGTFGGGLTGSRRAIFHRAVVNRVCQIAVIGHIESMTWIFWMSSYAVFCARAKRDLNRCADRKLAECHF